MSDTPQSFNDPEISDLCPSLIAIFGNYLISDRIFDFLPISNVLQCSLASNFFKKISRSYLRRRKRLEINLEFGKISQLTKLESMLTNCTEFPFVGSKLLLYHPHLCHWDDWKDSFKLELERDLLCHPRRSQRYDVLKRYPYVFQKLPVKTLRIDFTRRLSLSEVRYHDVCFCEDVLKQLIIKRASNTEYLEIIRWPIYQGLWEFLRVPQQSEGFADFDQSNIFRSLRTCNFRNTGYGSLQGFEEFISQIAISSPFLENIYGPLHAYTFFSSDDPVKHPNFQNPRCGNLSLPESKFHAIREIFCECRWMINRLLKIQPNLEVFGFNLQAITEVKTDKGETKTTAKIIVEKNLATIIENCKKSLTTLVCQDAVHMLYHVINVQLVNCVHLKLVLSASYKDFEDVLLFLKAIDFQKYLYNLRRVDLIFRDRFNFLGGPQKEIGDRSLICKRDKYTCLSVKTLLLKCYGPVDFSKLIQPHLYIVAELFPNVKSLHVKDEQSVASRERGPQWLVNFKPEDFHYLGLPWNRTLEFVSCYGLESLGNPCLILLTKLLESICDVTAEQLSGASRDEFNKWSYQPTRQLWFKRSCRILLRLRHSVCYDETFKLLCPIENFGELETTIYRPRFDRIFSWIQAKLPEFSLVLEFKPCALGKLCNPIPFYNGRIQTDFEENRSFISLPRDFRTWLLNF